MRGGGNQASKQRKRHEEKGGRGKTKWGRDEREK
jgi:hypothetical protein